MCNFVFLFQKCVMFIKYFFEVQIISRCLNEELDLVSQSHIRVFADMYNINSSLTVI